MLKRFGLQKKDINQDLQGITILPTDYLCPLSLETRKLVITENTFSIHHYDGGWKKGKDKFLSLKIKIRRWIGDNFYESIKTKLKG